MKIILLKKWSRFAALSVIGLHLLGCAGIKSGTSTKKWVATWATAPMQIDRNNMPPEPGLSNNTLRQIVRVSIGGNLLKLRFSNKFSKASTHMKSVSIAVAKEDGSIDAATQKMLRFNGKNEVELLPNAEVVSDSLVYALAAGSRLAITIYFGDVSASITGHPGSRTNSYLLSGDRLADADFKGAVKAERWYVINGIDVKVAPEAAAIAVLGNSITDGRGSGTDKQNRWTDVLSERVLRLPATSKYGVLNLGIGGNCVVRGGLGPTALQRFDRDILAQSNVKWLIILEGVNDIGGIRRAEDVPAMVKSLTDAYSLMADKAHEKNIKVYGCTILPFAKSSYDTPFRLEAWRQVNEWIRTSKKFDAVIDFAKIMQSADDQSLLLSTAHTGDFLHPNELGYKMMGEAIDLNLFSGSKNL